MEYIRKLHAHLIVAGSFRCSHPISKVLIFYALSEPHLSHAHQVFDQIEHPNSFIWNTMIRGFSKCSNKPEEAILFYNRMRANGLPQDNFTFPFVLKACSELGSISEGERIHSHALKLGLVSDLFTSNALIHLYASCGELSNARLVFDGMVIRDLVSWNSLICGYGQCKRLKEVLGLFEAMRRERVKADKVTMVKVLTACTHLGEWGLAELTIKYIEENHVEVDVYLGNSLIDYYGRRGLVESAEKVFSEMKEKNVVSMNAMITTYSKVGDLVSARKIFDSMQDKDLISWSAMISGYSQANHFNDALVLFRQMQRAKVKLDEVIIVSVLSACAHLGLLDIGKWIHNYIQRNKIKADVYVGNSLIDMYSKCGCIVEGFKVFKEMKQKDTLTWNSIIFGLATNGNTESALTVFLDMLMEGFQPNGVTFLGVLIACVHSGLVDKGLKYFESMKEVHGVEPEMKHYGCIVDLLGRSGELDRAFEFIEKMPPMTPDPVVWRTLLGGCKVHGNVGLAEIVTKKLADLDYGNGGDYVLLSNTYASANRWNEAMKVRELMTDIHVEKMPGCSSVQVCDI